MTTVGCLPAPLMHIAETLITQPAFFSAAVIGGQDADGLIKPKAYVLLKSEFTARAQLQTELQSHVKSKLAPYKYPRWVEFVDDLPKTVTGKIQRFRLRSQN